MRIGINAHFLKPGRVGGSEVYTRNLIEALGRIDHNNIYYIFTTSQNRFIFQNLPSNFHLIFNLENRIPVDLIHFPGTTIKPLSLKTPCVITVHDLQHLYWPGNFSLRERLRRWRRDRPSIHKSSIIIAISNFTRQTIIEKFPEVEDKVTTIHSGVSADYFQPVSESLKLSLKQEHNLPDRFLLYPARPWPHKKHKRLFEALLILQRHHQVKLKLVLSGFERDEVPADWQPLLESLGGDTVQIVGYLPRHEMVALYQTADCLVFPSLFEGFGLPVLEAMAAGTPAICSDAGSLPEVAGDAAVFVDPFDSFDLAEAIYTLHTNPAMRKKLIETGRIRAAKFSWDSTAEKTLDLYKTVA
jgi:glycosyltransferase involved in cell wall biosynthesis